MISQVYIDQMNNEVRLENPPVRIISLVPSQTELLFDLGLDEEIIGITKFCIHPEEKFKITTKIGGTKKLDIEKIHQLKPDLIIGNKEENEEQQIKELMQHYPVWMSDIHNLDEALDMIAKVGELVDRNAEAYSLIQSITNSFNQSEIGNPKSEIRVAYFIWKDPYMVAAKNTFIDDMLNRCGFINAFSHLERYPEISGSQLQAANSQLILLSSEPYPFKEKHIQEFKSVCPDAEIKIVDGEMFSWYGSRLKYAPEYFKSLINNI
jgi:ABC-type Fe3+-hydroxamate transport system substrate-binding protein